MNGKKSNSQYFGLFFLVLVLLGGLFYLALIDSEYRPIFADLVKMGLAAYIGWVVK